MAYYHQHHTQPARVRTRAHSDHTGAVLAGVALLMVAVLALVWLGQSSTLSALPQAAGQPASAVAPIVTAPILSLRAPPAVTPPASDVIAAAGDTRALQP